MKLFDLETRTKSARHRRLYAIYEIVYTMVDFSAAILFLIGSVMFFYQSLTIPGTWCFVVGSVFFAAKPTLRLIRELHMLAMGDFEELAEQAES